MLLDIGIDEACNISAGLLSSIRDTNEITELIGNLVRLGKSRRGVLSVLALLLDLVDNLLLLVILLADKLDESLHLLQLRCKTIDLVDKRI